MAQSRKGTSIELTITEDNSVKFLAEIDKALRSELDYFGTQVVYRAKSRVHVITGHLRSTIGKRFIKRGTNVELVVEATAKYAKYEEARVGHEYLLPAWKVNLPVLEERIRRRMGGSR